MSRTTTDASISPVDVGRNRNLRQRSTVLALLVAVIVLDQVTKWWAWRHEPEALINTGGNVLVGPTIGSWLADPATGAMLDVLDLGLLSVAVSVLVRRRRPAAFLVSGTLMIGGWGSNLLDRLGMHHWSAPGSRRGAVDFIPFAQSYYNVADIFIACGTLMFLLAVSASYLARVRTPKVLHSVNHPFPRSELV